MKERQEQIVEERKVSFREKSNDLNRTQSAIVRIDMEVYDQITDISDRSGLTIREVTSRLLKFSLGNIEWEN